MITTCAFSDPSWAGLPRDPQLQPIWRSSSRRDSTPMTSVTGPIHLPSPSKPQTGRKAKHKTQNCKGVVHILQGHVLIRRNMRKIERKPVKRIATKLPERPQVKQTISHFSVSNGRIQNIEIRGDCRKN